MKKLILLLCAASICMMAIGCGAKADEGATPGTTTEKGANDPAGDTKPVDTK